ncbi:MAG: AI-2E family transporter [Burkholderiaceae bacterium]|nr:AI-2E family transporter [Burkholderiaceae bacterium]
MSLPPDPKRDSVLDNKAFLIVLVAVSLGFGWILWPFFGSVFWGVVLAILFAPLHRRLKHRMPDHPSLAALVTLAAIVLIVLLPLAVIAASLTREVAGVYARTQSGELDFGRYFEQIVIALPAWITDLLNHFGFGNIAALKQKLTAAIAQGTSLIATQALNIGQNTFEFIVSFVITIYLVFFLLRDGAALALHLNAAIPLDEQDKLNLLRKFTTVIRATVKGNVVVAATQGALGGLAFWFLGVNGALLWAVLMAFLSLLPAVGAGLIWLPVALYFLVTGSVGQGIALIAYGVLVIGLVDNVLRPILVGKDTKMPDYVVLISTLGGMAAFGLNGFVIGPVIAAMFMAVWDIYIAARGERSGP